MAEIPAEATQDDEFIAVGTHSATVCMTAKEDTGVGKSMSLEIKRSLSYFQ